MSDSFTIDDRPAGLSDIAGFRTGVAACGLKAEGPDVGVVLCEAPGGTGSAVISHTGLYAPAARVSSPRAASGYVRAVVLNSGNANCCTGEQGLADAREMIVLASGRLSVPHEQIALASAGEVGVPLPMDSVREGIEAACRDALETGAGDVATAVLPPGGARRVVSCSGALGEKPFRLAGLTRGLSRDAAGAPTGLSVMVTDIAVRADCLGEILRDIVGRTFERLEFDRGMSAGDTVCLLASGRAGNAVIEDAYSAGVFAEALEEMARRLALELAFEGEEGTRLVEITVTGATTEEDAALAARAITGSTSVRMALHRGKPVWGLLLAAAGRLGARVVESRATVRMGGVAVCERGRPARSLPDDLAERLASDRIAVELDLGLGEGAARLWTSDLSDGERERVSRIEAERDAALAQRAELGAKLERTEADRTASAREAKSARVSLELAERDKKKLRSAGSELEEVKKKIEEIEAEKTKALKESRRLRIELEIAERKASRKPGRAAKEAGTKAKPLGEADAKADAADLAALKKKLAEAEKARAAAKKEADSLKPRLERAMKKAAAASAERDKLKERLEEAREAEEAGSADRVEEIELELQNRDAEIEDLRAEVEDLRGKTEKSEKLDEAREKEADDLDRKLEAARKEVASLKAQLELKDQLVKQMMDKQGGE